MNRLTMSIVALLLCFTIEAKAGPISVVSDNQGWVNSAGTGNGGSNDNNTFTGNEFGDRFNSWASFTLPVFGGPITSATLKLTLVNFPPGDTTVYATSIFDVSTLLSDLLAGTSGVAGYTDLGTGNLYGTTASPGTVSVVLSAQAIADINAASGGTFIIGFTNDTLNAADPNDVDLGFYNNNTRGGSTSPELVLDTTSAVPEPASLTMLGLGVAGLFGFGLRRRNSFTIVS